MLYKRGQIAIEFVVVYAIILLIFALVFSVVTSQRAIALNSQQQALMQIQASEIAYYINHAIGAGSGYSIVVPLTSGITSVPYNLTISTTGVVQITGSTGGLPIQAYAFSAGRGLIINGTLLSYSANGINVYSIPTYSGAINVSNYGGIIYINSRPVSTVGLLANPIIQTVRENYVAYFNGANSLIYFPYNSMGGRLGGLTSNGMIELWVKRAVPAQTGDLIAKFEPITANSFDVGIGVGPCNSNSVGIYTGNTAVTTCLGGMPADTNWHQIGIAFNSIGEALYIDGVKESQSGASIPVNWGPLSQLEFGNGIFSKPFGGYMADVELYNGSLTQSQIVASYKAGIFGAPVSNSTVAGWWPLENNAYDYSGNSYDGQYDMISFQNAAEVLVFLATHGGSALINVPVGFVASNAIVGPTGFSGVVNSIGVGTAREEVLYNTTNPNVTVYGFDGNVSTANTLVGWWPLSFGDIEGSTAYDLSGYSNNGITSSLSWLPQTQQTNFAAASFPGDSNNLQASNSVGFITVNATGSLFNVSRTGNFTLVTWVKYAGGSPAHCEGIFGGGGNATTGFQLMGYGEGGNCNLFYGSGYDIPWPSGTYNTPLNRWVMLTAEYDQDFLVSAYNAPMYVYLNNTLLAKYNSTTTSSRVFVSTSPVNNTYYIGDDAWDPQGLDTYNGLVSDVQLYSTFLTQAQINTLYKEGPTSIPIVGAQIAGWWPLNGNANDSSGYGNQGVINYNVIFRNSAYNYTIGHPNIFQRVASFPTNGNVVIANSNSMNLNGQFSVSLWFSSYLTYSTTFTSTLFDALQPNSGGAQIELCGSGSCGVTGLYANLGNGANSIANTIYPFNFAQNTWYHAVLTAGSGAWTLYLNGQAVKTGTYSGTAELEGSTYGMQIGGGSGPSGSIDQIADVQVYNGVLTQAQVTQLFQQGIPTQQTIDLTTG